MMKFLSLIHAILCVIVGFLQWYLIVWFLTNQNDPFQWRLSIKIIYLILSMVSSEVYQKAELNIKNKTDE